jgi:hypothetical protein
MKISIRKLPYNQHRRSLIAVTCMDMISYKNIHTISIRILTVFFCMDNNFNIKKNPYNSMQLSKNNDSSINAQNCSEN